MPHPRSPFTQALVLVTSLIAVTAAQTSSSPRPIFTLPASVDQGASLLPNIQDPQAPNAQAVCPGYQASDPEEHERGLKARLRLAGEPCNVYGTDVRELEVSVEYQAQGRLGVRIVPVNLVSLFCSVLLWFWGFVSSEWGEWADGR